MLRFLIRLTHPKKIIRLAGMALLLWMVLGLLSNLRSGATPEATQIAQTDAYVEEVKLASPVLRRRRGLYQNYPHVDDVIVYNRVPKCASTSMRLLTSQLTRQNNFNLHVSRTYAQEYLNQSGQKTFVETVTSMGRPLIFIRHVFFVNFTRYDSPSPIYINMIRDPLDRLVSDYYYKRYNLRSMFPMSEDKREMTYNQCVESNNTECIGDNPRGYHRIIPYFCGQHTFCLTPSRESVEQAKRNIDQYYLVVGLVDHVAEFLQVLETLLPQFFSGAHNIYKYGGDKFRRMAKTRKKDPVDPQTWRVMKKKLSYDYEFYEFIKQRFRKLYWEVFHKPLIDIEH